MWSFVGALARTHENDMFSKSSQLIRGNPNSILMFKKQTDNKVDKIQAAAAAQLRMIDGGGLERDFFDAVHQSWANVCNSSIQKNVLDSGFPGKPQVSR